MVRFTTEGGGLVGVPVRPSVTYQIASATAMGASHSRSRRRSFSMAICTATASAKKRPIPEKRIEALVSATAGAMPRGPDRRCSASSAPSPHATEPTKAIWKAHKRFSQPAPRTRTTAAAAMPMRSPLRRRTSSKSRKALVACSASSTAM